MDLIEQLSDILKLLIASDELLLEELFEYLRDYLTEQRHNWILRDLILVFNTVHKHANCEFLQYCFETICFIHPVSLIASDKFPSLDRDMCYYFFENEVLTQIKEIVVWDHLIIWGTEQTPEDLWISRYKFNTIYRGSIDGINNKSFKNKCKGQVESLVLIKVNYSNKIFGGYSSIGFNSIEDSLLRIYNDN
ncbi:unnamed protein product [Rhizophagus irregularis]|nr:unnamed protein product [Rhizophagus irregularis]